MYINTDFVICEIRIRFHYMAISDEKQRVMPMPEDLLPNRGKQLIVPESVLLVNPINPHLKGEVTRKRTLEPICFFDFLLKTICFYNLDRLFFQSLMTKF